MREELEEAGIKLNPAAEELFADSRFTTAAVPTVLECVELSIADLGHPDGTVIESACRSAVAIGLQACPIEVGPCLRLKYRDQPEGAEGHPPSQHCAPPGSLTVVSPAPAGECSAPRGFYLRRIHGSLWLRGYRSDDRHVWSPEDRLLFARDRSGI